MTRALKALLIITLLFVSSCTTKREPELPTPRALLPVVKPLPCIDTLAAAQYGGQLKHIPLDYAIGGFANTFGDFFPVAKKELQRGRKYIRVNLLWSDSHSFGDKDLKPAIKEARRYQSLCTAYPDRTIELSPFTEHNLSNPDKLLDVIQANAPNCKIINSPWRGKLSSKYKNEVHGDHAKPSGRYNYSYDGKNAVDSNVTNDLKTHSGADIFCIWHPRLNLKWSMKDPAGRPQRLKEAKDRRPNKKLLQSLVYLFTGKGETSIPGKWLVKSHAEKHEKGDLKGDKLLIISPVKGKAVQLKRSGKNVGKLNYYGTFDGGGYRYYAPKFGYQYGKDLDVFIGQKKYGVINGGFRDGYFR